MGLELPDSCSTLRAGLLTYSRMIQVLQPLGDEQGIVLPVALLRACGIESVVEIEVRDGELVLHAAARHPRAGWTEQLRQAIAAGQEPEGEMLPGIAPASDEEEWEWPEDLLRSETPDDATI